MQFSQNPAVSEPRPGGKLVMYNGMIEGEYISLEQNKKIEMKWKFKDWGDSYAHVTIDLNEDEEDVSLSYEISFIFSVIYIL